MSDNNPIRRYSEVDIKFLSYWCDEDECEDIRLVFEGTYEIVPEVHKLVCPKCQKVFNVREKPGIVYIEKK